MNKKRIVRIYIVIITWPCGKTQWTHPSRRPHGKSIEESVSVSVDCGVRDAARRGCAEIRRVQAKGIKKIDYKVAGDARSALTEADVRAQRVVTGSLIKTFGQGLSILGEEDGNEDAAVVDVSSIEPLNCDIVSFASVDEKDDIVLMENCYVIVDPVDGTRGIAKGGCTVSVSNWYSCEWTCCAGVIGLPFLLARGFSRDADADGSAIVYGIVGSADRNKGIVGCYNDIYAHHAAAKYKR